jgi:SRSO17 transposase
MTPREIELLGPELAEYLREFADCFGRSEPRENLAYYVRGQLSDLERKSAEPMALAAGIAPRTLQVFLADSPWDAPKLRDRVQQVVARDHGDPAAIAIVDETGHVKKGDKTPGVQRQYCGASGKVDNCIVTVHLCYATHDLKFATLLDSDLFLPEDDWQDPQRRREARIPEDVGYRPKWRIALEQLQRAKANGVPLLWVTADEGYGSKPAFAAGAAALGLGVVVEIPRSFYGWLLPPLTLLGTPPRRADNLARHSAALAQQPWTTYRIKESAKGPVVWEAKAAPFAFRSGRTIERGWHLVVARNRLDPAEVKYFLARAPTAKAVPAAAQDGSSDSQLREFLHVGFARANVERCFEDTKSELGLSHFEGRTYPGLLRHCYVTQLSHLFLVRQTQRLRGKKSRGDTVPGAPGGQRRDRSAEPAARSANGRLLPRR